jgi:hypothetical protein
VRELKCILLEIGIWAAAAYGGSWFSKEWAAGIASLAFVRLLFSYLDERQGVKRVEVDLRKVLD